MAAKTKPIGTLPQTKAMTNRLNGIFTSPAVQEMTSGKIGNARDIATIQPPRRENSRRPIS